MNVDLPADLVQEFDNFCDTHRIKKKAATELAIRQFLSKHRLEKQA